MKDWSKIKHFTPNEAWGNPDLIDEKLVLTLDLFRELIKTPIYVTYGTQGKHVARWHGEGLAVDFVVDLAASPYYPYPLDLIHTAMKLPLLKGLGIYPLAKHSKCKKPLGFHFDVRPWAKLAIWIAIPSPDPDKLIEQLAYNEENLKAYKLI